MLRYGDLVSASSYAAECRTVRQVVGAGTNGELFSGRREVVLRFDIQSRWCHKFLGRGEQNRAALVRPSAAPLQLNVAVLLTIRFTNRTNARNDRRFLRPMQSRGRHCTRTDSRVPLFWPRLAPIQPKPKVKNVQ
jgi:hypothetical protein